MKFSGIYKIQSKIKPERIYVGSAINIKTRWQCHINNLKRNEHENPRLQNHYNKYGDGDLQFSVLLGCERDNLLIHEQFFIDALNPWFNIYRYAYSSLGRPVSEETRRKISKAHKGRKCSEEVRQKFRELRTGWKLSEETKKKISESHKGIGHSPETREKLRLNHIGVPHPHTPEQNRKIGEAQRGKRFTEEHKAKLRKAKIGYTPWNKGIHTGQVVWNKGMKGVYGTSKRGKKLINGKYIKINAD